MEWMDGCKNGWMDGWMLNEMKWCRRDEMDSQLSGGNEREERRGGEKESKKERHE